MIFDEEDTGPSLLYNIGIMIAISALAVLCAIVVVHLISGPPESGITEGVDP